METARWAASGGNAQPWVVAAQDAGDTISVELTIEPEYRDNPSAMDIDGLAAALGLGCLAKNLELVAANDGFRLISQHCTVHDLVWSGQVNLEFKKDASARRTYSNADIVARVTNRYPFKRERLPVQFLEGFRKIIGRNSKLRFVEIESGTVQSKKKLIPLLAKIERVRCRNNVLLGSLLKEISFSKADGPTGIPSTQLGLPASDQAMLRFFKKVPAARALFKIGFDAFPIHRAVNDVCNDSDRVFFVESDLKSTGEDFETAFEFGRAFQELWLEANSHGVAFQPIGLPLIALGLWRGSKNLGFTQGQEKTLSEVTSKFRDEFGISFRNLVMGFRIGLPTMKAEIAPRKPPAVEQLAVAKVRAR